MYNNDENNNYKINNFFEKLKKLWKDKRYRSLFILIFYFLFFMILFIMLEANENNNKDIYTENETKEISFSEYQIYEFKTELNVNDTIYNISGKRYKDKYEFEFQNQLYTLKYPDILNSNFNTNIINTFNYNPSTISNIIDNSELISEKKIISNEQIIKEYQIDLSKILNILDFNLPNYNNEQILIITSELNNQITEVEIDLTNLYKYFEEDYQKYKIKYQYNNLNNINEF